MLAFLLFFRRRLKGFDFNDESMFFRRRRTLCPTTPYSELCKMAELIEMPFALSIWVGPFY